MLNKKHADLKIQKFQQTESFFNLSISAAKINWKEGQI